MKIKIYAFYDFISFFTFTFLLPLLIYEGNLTFALTNSLASLVETNF